MKRFILSCILFFPVAALAQSTDSGEFPWAKKTLFGLQQDSRPEQAARTKLEFTLEGQSGVPQQRAKATQAGAPAQPTTRPPIEGSMVGYIENAIVGSQVRIRFEAGFDNDFPDRAEFFYAKCGCYKGLANIVPQAFDPSAPGPGPGVPKDLNFQQLYFNVEYAPVSRFSVFAEVPIRWIQPQGFLALPPFAPFGNQGGLGDVKAGIKLAVLASDNRYLTFQFRTYAPSGDESRGLGTGHVSIEPALLYYQKLTGRLALESQVGDWHPIEGSAGVPTSGDESFAGDVFFYGVGPSYLLYESRSVRFAPVLELVGWHVLGGFQSEVSGPVLGVAREVSGMNIVNIKIGARTSIGKRNSFYVGYGRVLTEQQWYKDVVRVEYRMSF